MPDSGEPQGSISLVEEVSRIVALDAKPVVRNLLITQCYHDLSRGLAEVLGGENANWCTYATWASKTAGQFIRREEVPELLRGALLDDLSAFESRLADEIATDGARAGDFSRLPPIELLDCVTMAVSVQITLGNLEVFSELGPVFARFIDAFREPSRRTPEALEEQLAHLRSGASSRDGQSLLAQAVGLFFAAMMESDAKKKAEKMLHANGLTGLHEQIRLQPYIAGSLVAPVEEVMEESISGLASVLPGRRLEKVARGFLRRVLTPIAGDVEEMWVEVATRALMTLRLPEPDGELRLGRDLDASAGRHLYPAPLHTIEDVDLAMVLDTFGALHDDPHAADQDDPEAEHHAQPAAHADAGGAADHDEDEDEECGAEDWSRLGERMHYIFPLFRSRQRLSFMLEEPFTSDQKAEILDDRIPVGANSGRL